MIKQLKYFLISSIACLVSYPVEAQVCDRNTSNEDEIYQFSYTNRFQGNVPRKAKKIFGSATVIKVNENFYALSATHIYPENIAALDGFSLLADNGETYPIRLEIRLEDLVTRPEDLETKDFGVLVFNFPNKFPQSYINSFSSPLTQETVFTIGWNRSQTDNIPRLECLEGKIDQVNPYNIIFDNGLPRNTASTGVSGGALLNSEGSLLGILQANNDNYDKGIATSLIRLIDRLESQPLLPELHQGLRAQIEPNTIPTSIGGDIVVDRPTDNFDGFITFRLSPSSDLILLQSPGVETKTPITDYFESSESDENYSTLLLRWLDEIKVCNEIREVSYSPSDKFNQRLVDNQQQVLFTTDGLIVFNRNSNPICWLHLP